MPRAKTSSEWLQQIAYLAESGESAARIERTLKVNAEGQKVPSGRVIREVVAKQRALPLADRRPEQPFHWPDCMGGPDLPWQASRVCLDLLKLRVSQGRPRPSVRLTRWYWRVTLASPDIGPERAERYAKVLSAREYVRAAELAEQLDIAPIEAISSICGRYRRVWSGCLRRLHV